MAARFRLVAFDLDGTLLGSELRIRPRVRDAIAAMQRLGVRGCVVSGRMCRATVPFAEELRFDAPVVCYHGAIVVEPPESTPILEVPLPSAVARSIVAFAKELRLHVQLFAGDEYYCEERNQYSELYAHISKVQPVIVPSLEERFASQDATKACIIAERQIIAQYVPTAQERFAGRAYVTRSIPSFMEFMSPNVNKAKALALVAQRTGVRLEETMAIGDAWNDAPLLAAAGFGVAMGSAPPELLAVANAVVADVEHDGVAEALERFVLS